ncbi:MAG: hypothetical protein LBQ09_12220 [Acidobacteriaceae bacterium]|jgi:hypothetical protein|nr:hypothetical protein [Acidobacteriaceae bacterium]
MYNAMLAIHSWTRWVVLVAAVAALVNAARSLGAPDSDAKLPGRLYDTLFMASMDLQLLFGLLLYFGLSPFTKEAMSNIGSVMSTSQLRFWSIEHPFGMLVAIVFVRVGRITSGNAATPASARKKRLVWFALALLVVLVSIPWPGLPNGRPLFRLGE